MNYKEKLEALLEKARKGDTSDELKCELAGLFKKICRPLQQKVESTHAILCCPYHKESIPSCAIDRNTKEFRCFGCGETGKLYTNSELAIDEKAERSKIGMQFVWEEIGELIQKIEPKSLQDINLIKSLLDIHDRIKWFLSEHVWTKDDSTTE